MPLNVYRSSLKHQLGSISQVSSVFEDGRWVNKWGPSHNHWVNNNLWRSFPSCDWGEASQLPRSSLDLWSKWRCLVHDNDD